MTVIKPGSILNYNVELCGIKYYIDLREIEVYCQNFPGCIFLGEKTIDLRQYTTIPAEIQKEVSF